MSFQEKQNQNHENEIGSFNKNNLLKSIIELKKTSRSILKISALGPGIGIDEYSPIFSFIQMVLR
jgi:hypothetical protein